MGSNPTGPATIIKRILYYELYRRKDVPFRSKYGPCSRTPMQGHGTLRSNPVLRQLVNAQGLVTALINPETGRKKGLRMETKCGLNQSKAVE
jgi:hypothetical protein